MKVFDFDNTIYRGESSVDFSFYMIRYNRKILRYIPTILLSLVGYKLVLLKKERLESIINNFFAGVLEGTESPSDYVKSFWDTHAHKLNRQILQLVEPEDVIISASPILLLDGIREHLKTDKITRKEIDDKKLDNLKYIAKHSRFSVSKNNEVTYYEFGEKFYPELLKDLKKAEKFIFMEYFIIN